MTRRTLALTLLCGFQAGCAEQRSPLRAHTLVAAITTDPGHLNPAITTNGGVHTAADLLYDGLVSIGDDLKPQPALAERWAVEDGGARYRFFLRHDVKWTDGEAFTARDVEFGFNLIRDPATLTAYAEDYKQVQSFEVIDDWTFRVVYEKPFAPALSSWGSMVVRF